MSYCRFIEADAYIFENVGGWLECCWCPLIGDTFKALTSRGMLRHIEQHRKAGDFIPLDVDARLLRDHPILDMIIKTGKVDYMKTNDFPKGRHKGLPAAYKVRSLSGFRGEAALYELDIPYRGNRFVVASAVDVPSNIWVGDDRKETLVFASNPKGDVDEYRALASIGHWSHVDVLMELGYTVRDRKPEVRPSVEEFYKWLDKHKQESSDVKEVLNAAMDVLNIRFELATSDLERQKTIVYMNLLKEPLRWSERASMDILKDDFPAHFALAHVILKEG